MITVHNHGRYVGALVAHSEQPHGVMCYVERTDGSREYGYFFPTQADAIDYALAHHMHYVGALAKGEK